jgi:hypothetical protein
MQHSIQAGVGICGFLANNAASPQKYHNVNVKTSGKGCRGLYRCRDIVWVGFWRAITSRWPLMMRCGELWLAN